MATRNVLCESAQANRPSVHEGTQNARGLRERARTVRAKAAMWQFRGIKKGKDYGMEMDQQMRATGGHGGRGRRLLDRDGGRWHQPGDRACRSQSKKWNERPVGLQPEPARLDPATLRSVGDLPEPVSRHEPPGPRSRARHA